MSTRRLRQPPPFVDDRALTDDERAALDALLPKDRQTGDTRVDVIASADAMRDLRRAAEESTGQMLTLLYALYRDTRSWPRVSKLTGIPLPTLNQWKRKAKVAETVDTVA
jgi:hypothetical protein